MREFKSKKTVLVMAPSKRISVTPKSKIYFMFAVVIFIERSNLINYCLRSRTYLTFSTSLKTLGLIVAAFAFPLIFYCYNSYRIANGFLPLIFPKGFRLPRILFFLAFYE